ncbi:MAG: hypothetical protein WC655_01540, partial [Candidatus Hydrogenedentales bacterium]
MRRTRFCSVCLFVAMLVPAGFCQTPAPAPAKVDFAYSFSTPHRLTVARPDSGDKTLLDVDAGGLRMAWSFENLTMFPALAYVGPQANWAVRLTPRLEGGTFEKCEWKRVDDVLPVLKQTFTAPERTLSLEVTGGATAAIVRVEMTNASVSPATFSLLCESQRGFFGYNPSYVDG